MASGGQGLQGDAQLRQGQIVDDFGSKWGASNRLLGIIFTEVTVRHSITELC